MVAADTHPLYIENPNLIDIHSTMFTSVLVLCIIMYRFVVKIPMISIRPIMYPVRFASLKNMSQKALRHMLSAKIQPMLENIKVLFLEVVHESGSAC